MNEDPLLARFVGARMRDVKRQPRAEACYSSPATHGIHAVPTAGRMSTFLIQIVLLVAGAARAETLPRKNQ
jgi:hypothetical protein